MTAERREERRSEEFWRDFMTHPDSLMTVGRHLFRRLPSDPRCQLCAAPFSGLGGRAMQVIGKRPSTGNPNVCNSCEDVLIKYHGGAEVEGTMLFADIRGSTALGEQMSPTEFRALLDRFYGVASKAVYAHGGIVDKFVGDELVAAFPPMLGADHVARAVAAAREVLEDTGHGDSDGPWAPVGAGVHVGRVWFGTVGEGIHVEITVVGDAVNTTARLAAAAQAGEVLVSADAAAAAGLDPGLPRRSLELKGKEHATEVVSLRVGG